MSESAVSVAAPELASLLSDWVPRQRWFAGSRDGGVTVALLGGMPLRVPASVPAASAGGVPVSLEGAGVQLHVVRATSADGSDGTYQVPLTYRAAEVPELAAALVGTVATPDGPRFVYDGPHDPAFVAAWLQLIATGEDVTDVSGPDRGRIRGVRVPSAAAPAPGWASRVMKGEQSNTSFVVSSPEPVALGASSSSSGDRPVIVKLFRVMQAGRNPDVTVPAALSLVGCESVPGLVGWVEGEWTTPDGTVAAGHLSAAAEFVAGATDGWALATRAVSDGSSFAVLAGSLGAATASVHAALARALPTTPVTPSSLESLAAHLRERLEWAVGAAPALAPYRTAAAAVIDAVPAVAGAPDLQSIHGDLHLGQCLYGEDRGWVLLDFEGEPLRPLAERGAPDLALRDVAGMLRSFDYAARHATLGVAEDDPSVAAAARWAAECRAAFLAGYTEVTGRDPRTDDVLLRALELDKALYEVVYEVRHRPDWVEVPMSAVARLLG